MYIYLLNPWLKIFKHKKLREIKKIVKNILTPVRIGCRLIVLVNGMAGRVTFTKYRVTPPMKYHLQMGGCCVPHSGGRTAAYWNCVAQSD